MRRDRITPITAAVMVVFLACGGGGGDGGNTILGPVAPQPSKLVVASGDAQVGFPTTPLAQLLAARVLDDRDVPLAGVAVNWTVVAGGGAVSSTAPSSDANGNVTATWTLGAVGAQRVNVSISGRPNVSAGFTATGVERELRLIKQAGDLQAAFVGRPLGANVVVKVVNQFDGLESKIPVVWTVMAGDGAVSMASVSTGADGTAAVQWTLGSTVGTQTVKAELASGTAVAFSATGVGTGGERIVFQRFPVEDISPSDIYSMNPDGTAIVPLTTSGRAYAPAWAPGGDRIAFDRGGGGIQLVVMNADGTGVTQLTNSGSSYGASWAPDGSELLFIRYVSQPEIHIMKADGTNVRPLVGTVPRDFYPAMSPDGARIAFSSSRDGNAEIYVMNADGSNPRNLTQHPKHDSGPIAWSPDGRTLMFKSTRDDQNDEIYLMDVDGTNVRRLTSNTAFDQPGAWSPNGSRIAFSSNRSGKYEIYIMNADGSNVVQVTQTAVGMRSASPHWRRAP